jgi:hypothetical protein
VAIDTNNLTTLAVLKTWLGVTDTADDIVLQWSIQQASRIVQTHCARNFTEQRYYEIRDTYGAMRLALEQSPVTVVRFVGVGWDSVLSINSTNSTDAFASVAVDADQVHLTRVSSTGTETASQVSFGSHDVSSEVVNHINTISGFSAGLILNVPSRYIRRLAGRDVRNSTAYLEAPTEGLDDYQIDLDRGMIYGKTLDRYRSVLVDYTAGYATIPTDVELATLTIAARSYRARTRDRSIASESLGGYSYSTRSLVEIEDEEKRMLAPYRRIR